MLTRHKGGDGNTLYIYIPVCAVWLGNDVWERAVRLIPRKYVFPFEVFDKGRKCTPLETVRHRRYSGQKWVDPPTFTDELIRLIIASVADRVKYTEHGRFGSFGPCETYLNGKKTIGRVNGYPRIRSPRWSTTSLERKNRIVVCFSVYATLRPQRKDALCRVVRRTTRSKRPIVEYYIYSRP